MAEPKSTTGFFGKLPSHGDFVSRRLPPGFVQCWDEWLQNVIACSREQLGDAWLEVYLTSPIWRFALSPNLVGEQSWTGILMPSVDRVGRYFPLTIAASVGSDLPLLQLIESADPWFERLDEIALATLQEEESLDLDDLAEQLVELGSPVSDMVMQPIRRQPRQPKLAMRSSVVSIDNLVAILPVLTTRLLSATLNAYGIWWTRGSDRITPSVLITEGLPPVQGFAALMDGQWDVWGWNDNSIPGTPVAN